MHRVIRYRATYQGKSCLVIRTGTGCTVLMDKEKILERLDAPELVLGGNAELADEAPSPLEALRAKYW